MSNNNSVAQMQNTLATVARELQLLADQNALEKVESAIAALEKLNSADFSAESL